MIAICREVDKNGGGIAVYPIESEVTERLLTCLTLRARLNPELRYFVTARVRWENESARKLIESSLRRKNVTASTIAAVGQIRAALVSVKTPPAFQTSNLVLCHNETSYFYKS